MKLKIALLLALLILSFLIFSSPAEAQDIGPTPTLGAPPSPADIINAVNNLRLSYGLPALYAHPVLMQIAQEQANGIASGLPGHWRPSGMTLGQWMMSLGYPLSGDLTLDGYRSENWGSAQTAEDAIQMWLGDDLHENTMLSIYRSDIGAGVAVWDGQFVIVIETALQTRSGQMQSNAASILAGIPQTQMAYSQMETQAAINGVLPQYSIPVVLNTPFPDGRVYHEALYGQTLWSIAVAYGITIKQIQGLNNLGESTTVYEGQTLLVRTDATLPAPAVPGTTTQVIDLPIIQTGTPSQTPFPVTATPQSLQEQPGSAFGVVAIIISALFLAGVFAVMAHKKEV
ncbi:MAG: LysM peptidoglycan-binding domain-containing protein [Chloroflexi bacterium]|nr:LysM peptidoglycan-binding domain-containing protein [Chloroflexota bacterium]MBI3168665.1 LysM peptidoglycan-binding domain-containing protein [Chloroflexota bacterium]